MKYPHPTSVWHGWLTMLPAIGLALLPRITCPCQLPAYAGLLASLGLPLLLRSVYLFPLTAACLTLSVGMLVLGARQRRGRGPFALGMVGAIMLLAARFVFVWDPAAYAAVALLLSATLWNAWPARRPAKFAFDPDGHTVSNVAGHLRGPFR